MIAIAAQLNYISGTAKKVDFSDLLYCTYSTIRALGKRSDVNLETVPCSTLAEAIHRLKALGQLGIRQVLRYTHIAARFLRNRQLFEYFTIAIQKCLLIGVVHLCSPALLGMEDDMMKFALACLWNRLESSKEGHPLNEAFEKTSRSFYTCVYLMYTQVEKTAAANGMSAEMLLDMQMQTTPSTSCTLQNTIFSQLRTFNRMGTLMEQGHSNNARLHVLQKNLISIFPDNIGEKVDALSQHFAEQTLRKEDLKNTPDVPSGVVKSEATIDRILVDEPHNKTPMPIESPGEPYGLETEVNVPKCDGKPNVVQLCSGKPIPIESPVQCKSKRRKRPHVTRRPDSFPSLDTPDTLRMDSVDDSHKICTRLNVAKRRVCKTRRNTVRLSSTSQRTEILDIFRTMSRGEQWALLKLLANVTKSNLSPESTASTDIQRRDIEESNLPFKDEVPETLPIGYENSMPCKTLPESPTKGIVRELIGLPPSQWPRFVKINDKQAWLNAIHIPEGHRAYFDSAVSISDLIATHHMTFLHAAFAYQRQDGGQAGLKNRATRVEIEESQFGPFNRGEDERWVHALASRFSAVMFFTQQSTLLSEKGFCILEGFLNDAIVPCKIGRFQTPHINHKGFNFFLPLAEEMERKLFMWFKRKNQRHGKNEDWNAIFNFNPSHDRKASTRKIGRYATTIHGMTVSIEQSENRVWAVRSRALVDVRVGQIAAGLKIVGGSNTYNKNISVHMPRTGGRWLYTTKNCERQRLHTDFKGLSREETISGTGNPGYFVLCSASEEVPLWVCEYSHRLIAASSERDVCNLSRGTRVVMIKIPPLSIFVGRGDLYHAGASYDDSPSQSGLMRYHMYLAPDDYRLSDAVNYHPHFNPRFKKYGSHQSDEENDGDEFCIHDLEINEMC